jgi:hypothetical protein
VELHSARPRRPLAERDRIMPLPPLRSPTATPGAAHRDRATGPRLKTFSDRHFRKCVGFVPQRNPWSATDLRSGTGPGRRRIDAKARALVARRNGEARPQPHLRFNQARPCSERCPTALTSQHVRSYSTTVLGNLLGWTKRLRRGMGSACVGFRCPDLPDVLGDTLEFPAVVAGAF